MNYILLLFLFPIVVFAQSLNKVELYIQKYKDLAVEHMVEYSIPASITLAQGILESGSGESDLAVESNNHFGIKCHRDWEGDRSYYDDDEENECFRKYKSASESYLDHSLFLKNKPRYSELFSLNITDYKGWAKGLKKAGYATDPNYANNLIRVIEKYYLYDFDKLKKNKKKKNEKILSKNSTEKPVLKYLIETYNNVPYIISNSNDSYKSISDDFGIWVSELLKFNDINDSTLINLNQNQRIYIKPKRRSNSNPSFHVVTSGQTIWEISQLYAVKLSSIYKKNPLFTDREVRKGDIVYLKNKKN